METLLAEMMLIRKMVFWVKGARGHGFKWRLSEGLENQRQVPQEHPGERRGGSHP